MCVCVMCVKVVCKKQRLPPIPEERSASVDDEQSVMCVAREPMLQLCESEATKQLPSVDMAGDRHVHGTERFTLARWSTVSALNDY